MTHLARDALLLSNNDVLLSQCLLQPLRGQHCLPGLQGCWKGEKAGGALWPGQALSSAHQRSEVKPSSLNLKELRDQHG